MDTPGAAVVHKENVHISGGKATVTMKSDKLKTAKTAGKKRKASEDLRSTYLPVVGASKDGNLKRKSTRKGNEVKKNQMTEGKQSKSYFQGFLKGNKPFDVVSFDEEIKQGSVWWAPIRHIRHTLTDEEMKQCFERAKNVIVGMGKEEREQIIKGSSPEFMKEPKISNMEIPGSKFGEAFTSEVKCYKKRTDESPVPGRLSSVYTPKELEVDCLDELWQLFELRPKLKLNDDY